MKDKPFVVIGVCFAIVIGTIAVFGQENDVTTESEGQSLGPVLAARMTDEVVGLKLDLIDSRRVALQLKAELLEQEAATLRADIAALQLQLNTMFNCPYDMNVRACTPKDEDP